MRIFKTKWLTRFSRRERISDGNLSEAIDRAERGLVDADLGSGLIKQRVARAGQGRSGGYRMLVAYRIHDRAIFLYGFAKSEQDNIEPDQLLTLKEVAEGWLKASDKDIQKALNEDALTEVNHGEESKKA